MLTELQNYQMLTSGDKIGLWVTISALLLLLGYIIFTFPARKSTNESRYRALMGEFVGTALLTAAVIGGGLGTVSGSLVAGIMITVLVYVFAPVSSAHFNPAVTLAALLGRKISSRRALAYFSVQLIAAKLAVLLLAVINDTSYTSSSLPVLSTEVIAEFLGTFLLIFVVATAVIRQQSASFTALLFGLTVAVAPVLTGVAAYINPAIAYAVDGSWASILLPMLGAIAGILVAYGLTIDRKVFKMGR